MKVKYLILSLIATAFLSSYISDNGSLKVGSTAPEIVLATNQSETQISLKDGYKLISFWDPKDPSSRISNKEYSSFIKSSPEAGIELVSICTDPDDFLAEEISRIDGSHEAGLKLNSTDISERVLKDYDVEKTPRSYLIGPDGKIKMISPEITDLRKLKG